MQKRTDCNNMHGSVYNLPGDDVLTVVINYTNTLYTKGMLFENHLYKLHVYMNRMVLYFHWI